MKAWIQDLENCDGKDADNVNKDIKIEDEELELDRYDLERRNTELSNMFPARRYKLGSQLKWKSQRHTVMLLF